MKSSNVRLLTKATPYLISITSFIFALQFLYHTVLSSIYTPNTFWFIFTMMITLFTIIGLRFEFYNVRATKIDKADYRFKELLKSCGNIIVTTMATYFIAIYFDTTTIFAGSLICVLSTYLFRNHQTEAYSGTVSGMIGAYLCQHWSIALFTGISTALFYQLFKPYFKGVGGRGGSISYSASILVVRALLNLHPETRAPLLSEYIFPSLIVILLTAYLTYYLHDKGYFTVVQAAMVTALVLSIIIPDKHYALTTAMFAGTVLGMSTGDRVDNYWKLTFIAIIGFVLFVPSYHILDGIGGKLGMLSLISYYGVLGLSQAILWVKKRFSTKLI